MTTWLRPLADRDKAMKDHLETTFFFDEETGELWEPTLDDLAGRDTDDDLD